MIEWKRRPQPKPLAASPETMRSRFPDPNLAANRIPHDNGAKQRVRTIVIEDDILEDDDGNDVVPTKGRADTGKGPRPLTEVFDRQLHRRW